MPTRPTILIATTNAGKLREVRTLLSEIDPDVKTLGDFSTIEPPVENADTFVGNAKLKAIYYAKAHGCLTLADDSGLEVDALGGEPGVRSARFAGRDGDDQANNAKLVRKMTNVPSEERTARFRCTLALASVHEVIATESGTLEGTIILEARGENGFGYDPHFYVPSAEKTAAEMSPEEKNQISHRGDALRAMKPRIEAALRQDT